jgi:hypothetical protein
MGQGVQLGMPHFVSDPIHPTRPYGMSGLEHGFENMNMGHGMPLAPQQFDDDQENFQSGKTHLHGFLV